MHSSSSAGTSQSCDHERRRAWDGAWYTELEFIQEYGPAHGHIHWSEAALDPYRCDAPSFHRPASNDQLSPTSNVSQLADAWTCPETHNAGTSQSSQPQRRRAWDDAWYTEFEFSQEYGSELGQLYWNEAGCDPGRCNIPFDTYEEQEYVTSNVSQLADNMASPGLGNHHMHGIGPDRCNMPLQSDDREAQHVFLTKENILSNYLPTVSGKAAQTECRRLRDWCFSQSPPMNKIEMTVGGFQWRCLLRSMHPATRDRIFGDAAIIQCNFLLLKHVRDSNYNGPRHVFEFVRSDGLSAYVHFHGSGKPDKPYLVTTGAHVELGTPRAASYSATVPLRN